MDIYDVYFERLSNKLKKIYTNNGFGFDYFHSKQEATDFVISNINKKDIITFGGSLSVTQLDLIDILKNGDYEKFIDRNNPDCKKEAEIKAFTSDVYLCSANAITEDGIVISIDGSGNRVSAMIYGPKKVYLIVGKNKLVHNEADAIKRAKNIAAAHNSIRFNIENPCSVKMKCNNDCEYENRLCSYRIAIEKSHIKERIHIIFINQNLGF